MGKRLLTLVLFSLPVSFMLTCCHAKDIKDKVKEVLFSEEYQTMYDLSNERQEEIMECIKSGDRERLKSFFADDILEKFPQIDDDINGALDFLDGEIVIFYGQAQYINTFAEDDFGYRPYGSSSFSVETDKGTEYVISFWGRLSDEDPPKEEGVICIRIKNISKEWPDMPDGWQENWRDYKDFVCYIGEPCI